MQHDPDRLAGIVVRHVAGFVAAELAPLQRQLDALNRQIDEERATDTGNAESVLEIKAALDVGLADSSARDAALATRIAALEERPAERGEKGDKGDRGDIGLDGRGLANAVIDRAGDLILAMTDGRPVNLGRVHGGDGLGFDDLSVEHDGERTVVLRFARGEHVKEFPLHFPVPIYRGVYRPDGAYVRGDEVTFGGSQWHCNTATDEKPGEGSTAWTLAVKRGRDGQKAKV